MNYIKRLEEENKQLTDVLYEMEFYLNTDKFNWPNDYVNVKDILNRLEPVRCLCNQNFQRGIKGA